MKTKWVITIMVAVLAAVISTARAESRPVENERQKRFDRNRDGQLDDREQAMMEEVARNRSRAEELQAQAKEHEELARKLRAESEELSRNLDRELQTRQPESPDRAGADKSADELRQWNEGMRDQQRALMKEKAVQLLEQARKAKQQGRHEQARELLAESERIKRRLDATESKSGPEEAIGNLKERLRELDEASDRAAAAGNPARAQALRQQAEQTRYNLDAANRRAESARMRNEIRELGRQADQAQSDGNREKASDIRKEAAALKQRLAEMENQPRPQRPRPMPRDPFFESFPDQGVPYPPRYRVPQRFSPYDKPSFGGPMDAMSGRGLSAELEFIRRQLVQLNLALQDLYQLAGEDPGD